MDDKAKTVLTKLNSSLNDKVNISQFYLAFTYDDGTHTHVRAHTHTLFYYFVIYTHRLHCLLTTLSYQLVINSVYNAVCDDV